MTMDAIAIPKLGFAQGTIFKIAPVYQYPFATTPMLTLEDGDTVSVTTIVAGWAVVYGTKDNKGFVGFMKDSDLAVEKDQMKQNIQVKNPTEAKSGPSEKFNTVANLASGTEAVAYQNINGYYRIQQGTWIKASDAIALGKPQPMNWQKYIPYALGGAAILGTLWIVMRERKRS